MAATSKFKGDFHFVNYDTSSRKASSNRHEIFSHVQSKYQRWKRQERVRQSRASAQGLQTETICKAASSSKSRTYNLSDALLETTDRALSISTAKSLSRPLCETRHPSEPPCQSVPDFRTSPLSSPFTSQLDPFFILPCHITHHDKSLLQYYLTAEQEPVYGHDGGDTSCPIRPWTTILLQSDQTYLQWVILATEFLLLQSTSAPADTSHMLNRKVHIYKLMSQAIADPSKCHSDNTLSAIAAAGVGEALLGNPAQGRKHLVAVRLLMERRGGSSVLQDMAFGQALPIIMSYIFNGTGEATFPDKRCLQEATSSFISTFQAMQGWNQNLRVEFEKARANVLDVANVQDLQQYRFSRRNVFGKTSKLRQYIEPQKRKTIPGDQQFHFVLLWILNKILYDLRKDHHNSTMFIELFLRDVESAEGSGWERDHTATDRICLRPSALFCILAGCAMNYSSENGKRQGILHAWDAVDILELMQLAAVDSQEEVTVLLSSWLINDECDIWYVGERRAREFQEEIETEWRRQQR